MTIENECTCKRHDDNTCGYCEKQQEESILEKAKKDVWSNSGQIRPLYNNLGTYPESSNNAKPVLSAADVRWIPRYSSTMEDDKMGRWARVAYAGKFDNNGFYRGKVCRWEIAWIKKLEIKGELKFTISYLYPSNGKHLSDNLEDAKKEVEQTFRWFMKMCVGKVSC